MAERMYEMDRDSLGRSESFLRKHSKPGERLEPGSPVAVALAHVEAHERKKAGMYLRDATEEFGARVQEEVEENGYERMRTDKLDFWKRVVTFMEKAMGAILRGLRIRLPWKYTRADYKAMGSLFEKKLSEPAGEPEDIFTESRKVSERYLKEREAEKRSGNAWKTKAQALTDTKKPIQEETYSAPKDSRMPHQKDAALDSRSESDDAKLRNIYDYLKKSGNFFDEAEAIADSRSKRKDKPSERGAVSSHCIKAMQLAMADGKEERGAGKKEKPDTKGWDLNPTSILSTTGDGTKIQISRQSAKTNLHLSRLISLT